MNEKIYRKLYIHIHYVAFMIVVVKVKWGVFITKVTD